RVLEDGRWQVLVPPAFEAAAELARAGVPADKRVEVGQVLHEHAQAMARAVVDLFVEHLWRPSDHNADDPEAWRALTEAVERLRPSPASSGWRWPARPRPPPSGPSRRRRPDGRTAGYRGHRTAGAQLPAAPRMSSAVSAAARMRALHPAISAGGTASSTMRAA